MKILFLDDSFQSESNIYGNGGIIIDGEQLKPFSSAIDLIKSKYGIPRTCELKWSPDPNHCLRTLIKGDRTSLYLDLISLFPQFSIQCICAHHLLTECHGMKIHNWKISRAKAWAINQQISWLAERFEEPYLKKENSKGMIIIDNGQNETEIIKSFEKVLRFGTGYQVMSNIAGNIIPANSLYHPALQIADIVIGITTSWINGGKWSIPLFPTLLGSFLRSDHITANIIAADPSQMIIGYGLKLFPAQLTAQTRSRFGEFDKKFTYNSKKGFIEKTIS